MATTVFTNVGEQWACECMAQANALDGHFVGWGTGAGVAAKTDTTLFTEATEARAVGSVSVTGSGATAKYQVIGTITADGAKTITNAGNFTASSGGTLIVHGDFTGIAVALNDQIQFTITLDPS